MVRLLQRLEEGQFTFSVAIGTLLVGFGPTFKWSVQILDLNLLKNCYRS